MRRMVPMLLLAALAAGHGGLSLATILAPPGSHLRVNAAVSPAESHYQNGLTALGRAELEAAAAHFRASQELEPTRPESLLGLAEVALRRGDLTQVEKLLQEARLLAPEDAGVHGALGRYALSRGRLAEAERALTHAAALAPDALAPRLELGGLYSNGLKRPADAQAAFEAATRIAPEHAGAHHGLGMALLAQGKSASALDSFRTAARLATDNPLPWHAQGRTHAAAGDLDRAMNAYNEALRIQPQFVPSRIDRGRLHLGQQRWAQARADFMTATQTAPANPDAQFGLGMAAQQLGEESQAREAYLAALEVKPDLASAYNNLAWLTVQKTGATDQALGWARQAVHAAPAVADFRDTLGWILHLRGDHEQARQQLEKALALKTQPHILYHLARTYLELGRREQARRLLTQALADGSSFEDVEEATLLLGKLQ